MSYTNNLKGLSNEKLKEEISLCWKAIMDYLLAGDVPSSKWTTRLAFTDSKIDLQDKQISG